MIRDHRAREAWRPQSRQDHDAVLRELEEVLSSSHFCNSKRYPALLQFIVKSTLEGKSDLLKERTLGVEVFDRPPTWDTNGDTVVRYTAGEVRKRLLLYYSEQGSRSGVRISLPAGSYVPEFLLGHEAFEDFTDLYSAGNHDAEAFGRPVVEAHGPGPSVPSATGNEAGRQNAVPGAQPSSAVTRKIPRSRIWLALIPILVLVLAAGAWWKLRAADPLTAVDDFWGPVLHDQRPVVICAGSVLFAQDAYSGEIKVGRNGDVEYPFVSMQIASGIAQVEAAMERSGVRTQLIASQWTTLTDLREHSVTMLGGYNNQWTMRVTEPLRFHFLPDPQLTIVDGMQPQVTWKRDQSVPYSSADDYALVARFRDATIDGWVVVLAGLGRNGTEAAAQFVTSPHYLDLLRERMGTGFGNRNIEVVLKVNVIEAKTGAPSIQAVYVW